MNSLEKYLRSEIERFQYALKVPRFKEIYDKINILIDQISGILDLVICSNMRKISDYESEYLPPNSLSKARQQLQQERDELVFRPDIYDIECLKLMLSRKYSFIEESQEIDETRFSTNAIDMETIGYILGLIEKGVQRMDECSDCIEGSVKMISDGNE